MFIVCLICTNRSEASPLPGGQASCRHPASPLACLEASGNLLNTPRAEAHRGKGRSMNRSVRCAACHGVEMLGQRDGRYSRQAGYPKNGERSCARDHADLQHAVSESEQYRGKDRRLQRFARREIEARRKTIDELSRLARVSPKGQSRASAVPAKDDQDYLRAMLRNHARQIELFEYGAGITVSM